MVRPLSEKTLFDQAVELPAAERGSFLDHACCADGNLRAAVDSLLAAHERAGRFLADPEIQVDCGPADQIAFKESRIDQYTLLEVLGEGGHGTVFLAEQDPPLRRKVALKVVKAGMDTEQVIRRFERERQTLAAMDHPNIAKVFDASSTESGHPYFVMELVNGRSIRSTRPLTTRTTPQNDVALMERPSRFTDSQQQWPRRTSPPRYKQRRRGRRPYHLE